MMDGGKLPVGKHNFTKVISVADSLQMFDVAVSCKNLLGDLISCSTQDQVVRGVSSQEADSSGNQAEANNPSQSGKHDEGKTFIILSQKFSPLPGPVEAEMEADISHPGQELTVNCSWDHQDTMPSASRSLQEDSGSGPDQPAHAEQSGFVEEELAEPPEGKGRSRDLAVESKSCKLDFFVRYESIFSEALSDAQAVLKRLEEHREIDASQKEALAACLAKAEEQSVFKKLLSKLKDALPQNAHMQDSDSWDAQPLDTQTLVSFLKLFQGTNPKLRAASWEREQGSGEAPQQAESTADEETLTARLLCFREELIQSVTQLSPILEFLEAVEEGFLTASEKQIVLDCCEGNSQKEAMDNLLRKVDEEKTLEVESLVKLLGAVKASFPGLQLLLDNLLATANISDVKATEYFCSEGKFRGLLESSSEHCPEKSVPAIQICQLPCSVRDSFPALQPVMQELAHVGLLTEGSGEKAGIRKWKVNNESQLEALGKDEDKAGGAGAKEAKESQDKASSKKSFVCKACDKAFRFYCRLKVHMKCCWVARGKQIQCKECSEVKWTKKELEEHQLEVHGMVGMAKKKKKRLSVACDICGREFAHASEHFDEKPFSCQECGAKFAANSMLKNHVRLHTGDQPFVCKHCLMTFMQASALACHTKKQHAEWKMCSCRRCHAAFARCIELSAPIIHVRTHSGDKPCACRGCGRGFRQARGLSAHLRTSHRDSCQGYGIITGPTTLMSVDQNHCSSKSSSLQCSSCAKTFTSTAAHRKHIKAEYPGSQLLCCFYCSMSFHSPRALQSHITSQHLTQTESTFTCELCGELFPSRGKLQGHFSTEHPQVALPQATTAQAVQVIQMPEQGAAEHITSFDDAQLVTLPESQVSQTGSELVTVTIEDLFDDSHPDL